MKIQLDRIPARGDHFEVEEPAAQYDVAYLDFVFRDPIRIAVDVQIVTGNVVVSGKIGTRIHMTCSRCLKAFSRDWENSSYHFDCQITDPHEIIDLTEHMREDIIVSLPSKPLCRDHCKGLCPTCGKDWNKSGCACVHEKGHVVWSQLNKLHLE